MSSTASWPSKRPVQNVTAANFTAKTKAFMQANDTGFVIALKPHPGLTAGDAFKSTPRPWGAWMAYWAGLPYKTTAMQARGYATTPTEWPSEFDSAATIQGDHAAADAFEALQRDQRERAKFLAGSIASRRRQPAPRQPFRPYPKLWEALAGDPETTARLDNIGSFEAMTMASRLFATEWIDRARDYIRRHQRGKVTGDDGLKPLGEIVATTIDISDFPPASATREELLAWEARQAQQQQQEDGHGRDGEGSGASGLATARTQEIAPLAGAERGGINGLTSLSN